MNISSFISRGNITNIHKVWVQLYNKNSNIVKQFFTIALQILLIWMIVFIFMFIHKWITFAQLEIVTIVLITM